MSSSPFARLRDAARRHLLDRGARPAPDAGRRQFFRRAGAGAAGIIGTGLLLPDEAWAGIEERAAEFGITPGTVVDAKGRPVRKASGAEPFIGEIMIFAGNFAVRNYALCNGQLLSIPQYTAVFSILGTEYGGNGQTTFALPNLQGRVPMHFGTGPGLSPRTLGQVGGVEQVTLGQNNLPAHSHAQPAFNAPGTLRRTNNLIPAGNADGDRSYAPADSADGALAPVSIAGASQPFSPIPPFLALNFQICLSGIFPSRD